LDCVWPPCCDMLGVVENDQIGVNRQAKRAQNAAPHNVAIFCVEMLRSFGRGFNMDWCSFRRKSLLKISVYLKKAKQQTKLWKVVTNRTPATATRPTPPRPNARWDTAHGRKGDGIFIEFGWGIGLTRYVLGFRIIIAMATISDISFFENLFVDCFNLAFAGSWKWRAKYFQTTLKSELCISSFPENKTRICNMVNS